MGKTLTEEQAEILRFASSGHNLLITGQAGAGKSTGVNAIRQDCRQRGLKVAVVCSSGIACKVYENGVQPPFIRIMVLAPQTCHPNN